MTTTPPPLDLISPTAPLGVAATAFGVDQIGLTWAASTDQGTGVAGYRVFRDGYRVSAYDRASPASDSLPSAPASATTLYAP